MLVIKAHLMCDLVLVLNQVKLWLNSRVAGCLKASLEGADGKARAVWCVCACKGRSGGMEHATICPASTALSCLSNCKQALNHVLATLVDCTLVQDGTKPLKHAVQPSRCHISKTCANLPKGAERGEGGCVVSMGATGC